MTTPNWVRLPDATPESIVAARGLKKVFTGDLDAPVVTVPYFAASEKVLLRAQIARITADTVLNVKGYLVVNEDDGSIAEPEEFVFPEQSALLGTSGWMHCIDEMSPSGKGREIPFPSCTCTCSISFVFYLR